MLVSTTFVFISAILSFTADNIHDHLQRERDQELAQVFNNARSTYYDVADWLVSGTKEPLVRLTY